MTMFAAQNYNWYNASGDKRSFFIDQGKGKCWKFCTGPTLSFQQHFKILLKQ